MPNNKEYNYTFGVDDKDYTVSFDVPPSKVTPKIRSRMRKKARKLLKVKSR